MFELRILTGLHRGATLPLDENPLVIGASDEADVVLVDPCMKECHATLTQSDTGWLLAAQEGSLYGVENNDSQKILDLEPGNFARIGNVWVMIADSDASWVDAPPEPIDVEKLDDDILEQVSFVAESSAPDSNPVLDMEVENESLDFASVEHKESQSSGNNEKRKVRAKRVLFVPIAVFTVLSAAAAYAITSKPNSQNGAKNFEVQAEINPKMDNVAADGRKNDPKAIVASNRSLSPEELRKAFRKRLADADLIKRFELTLEEQSWSMRADLDDEEASRFERILKVFMVEHNITFPVQAKVVSAEGMLPFKIRQVISGSNASVVTQDGERLYVGDESHGVRLIAIQENRLTFAGKRKIEVRW